MESDYTLSLIIDAQNHAQKEIEKLQKQVAGLQSSTKSASNTATNALSNVKKILGTLGITAVFAGATKAVKDGVESLIDYEASCERLYKITSVSQGATREQTAALIEQAEAIDSVGVATKEGIVAMQSQFATFDMSTQAIQALTPAMVDYVIAEKGASASAQDFTSMAQGMAQALEGNYASLTRTGFVLDEETKKLIETGTEMEKVEAIVGVLNSTYEGFNEYVANNTLEGQITKMKKGFDDVKETVAGAFMPTIEQAFQDINGYIQDVIGRLNENGEAIRVMVSQAYDTISSAAGNVIDVLKDVGDTCLELFFGIKQDGSNSAITFGQIFMAVLQKIGQGIEAASQMVSDLWTLMKTGYGRAGNRLGGLKEGYDAFANSFFVHGSSFQDAWGAANRAFGTYDTGDIDSVSNVLAEITDGREEFGAKVITQENELFTSFEKTKSYFSDINEESKKLSSGGGSGSGTSGGSSSVSSALKKEMEDYAKETKKMLTEKVKYREEYYTYITDKQMDAINELNDGYEEAFDNIQDKIKETESSIESLNSAIASLNDKMSSLKAEENVSIATEVIKAKNALAEMDAKYAGLGDIANSVSYSDLEGIGGIGKYDVDLIKEYKQYQDELTSAYAGLSQGEIDALNKQIEYQERYDSLNGVEKIREDYRVKQEEIQNELNSKINSLNQEQAILRTYEKEKQQLQKERMAALETEVKKYQEMETKKEEFEKKYMDILYTDQQQQLKRYEQLISKAEELARARERAARAGDGDGSRATGGPVYAGNSYLVGEQGPEMFVPSTNGTIVKNSDLRNGNEISINLNMGGVVISNGSDEEEFANNIVERITRELQLQKKGIYL